MKWSKSIETYMLDLEREKLSVGIINGLRTYLRNNVTSTFQLFGDGSFFSWLDSFYSRSTPVIAGPKRMSAREKAKATAWPFKTSLSGRLERKWEAAGNGPLLQWDRCRFSGLENEYPELVKIEPRLP